MNYCPCCGHALEDRFIFGRTRRKCPSCGFVFFRDPKVTAGVLAEKDNRALLVRRLYEPHPGEWALPAGFVDLPHPTTVYLTLGTVTNQVPEVFRTVLDACSRASVNVLVSTGPGVDPATVAGGSAGGDSPTGAAGNGAASKSCGGGTATKAAWKRSSST